MQDTLDKYLILVSAAAMLFASLLAIVLSYHDRNGLGIASAIMRMMLRRISAISNICL